MDAGSVEIQEFLAGHHPFDLLPDEERQALPAKLQVVRAKAGSTVLEPGQESRFLFMVRSGAVEVHTPEGQLLARLGRGEAFGIHALMGNQRAVSRVVALENVVLYLLSEPEFRRLKAEYPVFDYHFSPVGAERLRGARSHGTDDNQFSLLSLRTVDLMSGDPISTTKDTSVRQAAQIMRKHNFSCLPVTDDGRLVGMLTNGDLRNRVVAEGLSVDTPVGAVMSPDPVSIGSDSLAFDAMLMMTRRNISHLPVADDGRLAGIITNTNLLRKQTNSAVFMVSDIHHRADAAGLAEVVGQVPKLLVDLVDAGATAFNVGHLITSVCDAVTNRLIHLAEDKLGPAPVPYMWLACGSQGRQEQTGVGDQDNCMILSDDFVEAEHGAYFDAFAKFVCDGLNDCGYVYCPGDMMAMNPKWRQPLAQWQRYFASWIKEPGPMAQMLASVMFDLRAIHGDTRLYDRLTERTLEQARANSIFLAHMVSNALTHHPPLGFFRNFVLVKGGEHNRALDLKHNGVVPIVDLARIYALESGIRLVNTQDRLLADKKGSHLSDSGARDLMDAYAFIAITRLKHQAEQIKTGRQPDNFMAPEDLSQFERSHLKDAFQVVKTMQQSLSNTYQVGAR